MAHDRPARVAEEFRHELTAILARGGLKDPRVTGFVTVTGAKMSPDLREATVYVSIHPSTTPPPEEAATLRTGSSTTSPSDAAAPATGAAEAERERTMEGLAAAAGFLQREVSRALRLRHTPHLRFVYDESVERGDRIERLLREAKEKDRNGA